MAGRYSRAGYGQKRAGVTRPVSLDQILRLQNRICNPFANRCHHRLRLRLPQIPHAGLEPAAVLNGTHAPMRGQAHPPPGPGSGWQHQGALYVVASASYPLGSGSAAPRMQKHTHASMPAWPVPPGRKCITLELAAEHVQHLDAQAAYFGCTRAAYLRRLIVEDVRRQGPATAAGL